MIGNHTRAYICALTELAVNWNQFQSNSSLLISSIIVIRIINRIKSDIKGISTINKIFKILVNFTSRDETNVIPFNADFNNNYYNR